MGSKSQQPILVPKEQDDPGGKGHRNIMSGHKAFDEIPLISFIGELEE